MVGNRYHRPAGVLKGLGAGSRAQYLPRPALEAQYHVTQLAPTNATTSLAGRHDDNNAGCGDVAVFRRSKQVGTQPALIYSPSMTFISSLYTIQISRCQPAALC